MLLKVGGVKGILNVFERRLVLGEREREREGGRKREKGGGVGVILSFLNCSYEY